MRILAKALAKVEAKAKATTPARASRKDVDKGKTKVKVEEEEALTAGQTRTTRTRTRTEATPTLIQGGTPSPLEGSLVLPHAHKRRCNGQQGQLGQALQRARLCRVAGAICQRGRIIMKIRIYDVLE